MCERKYSSEEQTIIDDFKKENPHTCYYCNESIIKGVKGNIVTVDHKLPISRGGLTVNENLVIACYKCNSEKDNMTVEEYQVYKRKQQELNDNDEVTKSINELIIYHNNITNKNAEITLKYNEIEKELDELKQDIMWGEHNACEGYLLNKRIKELWLKQEELKTIKNCYGYLSGLLNKQRKDILDVKEHIQNEINNSSRIYLKKYVMGKCKGRRSKVVSINKLAQTAK